MELHRINQLSVSALHHHLVATEVRRRQKLKSVGHAIELQAVVLPDAKDAWRRVRIGAVDVRKDRIARLGNANEAILILLRTTVSLLVLLELIERDHARAKTQTNQLVPAADCKHGSFSLDDKLRKVVEDGLLVIIKIAQRATEHNRIGLEALGSVCYLRQVRNFYRRTLHESRNVV